MFMSVNGFAPAGIVFGGGPGVFHGTSERFMDALMERFTLDPVRSRQPLG